MTDHGIRFVDTIPIIFNIYTGFYTGPNLAKVEFLVTCGPVNSTCTDPSSGNETAGILPKAVSYIEATVTGLAENTTYWCYVSSSIGKVTKCQGPLEATTGVQPTPVIPQANLFGSNFGNSNPGAGSIFRKFPIVDGSYESLLDGNIAAVSLSGNTGAILGGPPGRRRKLMATASLRVSEDMSAQTPQFDTTIDTTGIPLVDISLSGKALAGVDFSGSLYYTSDYATANLSLVEQGNFSKVALSDPSVLVFDDEELSLGYSADIEDASLNITAVNTTGLDLSSGEVYFSLSGAAAAVTDSNGTLFYTPDIMAPVWTQIPFPPSISDLKEVSLAGKQVVVVDSSLNPSGANVWYAEDITKVVDENSWISIGGALRSVSISEP